MGSGPHLKALLNKNWILWKRSWCCSCAEIIIPALFAFLFVAFRGASPIEDIPQISYSSKPYKYEPDNFGIKNMLVKNCSLSVNGGKVALSPPGNYITDELDSILTDLGFDTVFFEDADEMDSFVKESDYARGEKRLCFGVAVTKSSLNTEYEYYIRFNTSRRPGDEDIPVVDVPRVKVIEK